MQKWGADVRLLPTVAHPPLPESVALSLTAPVFDGKADLAIHHVSPPILHATEEWREHTDFLIGWTMWEWTSLRPNSIPVGKIPDDEVIRERMAPFDLVLAYDEVSREALQPVAPKLSMLQGGYDPGLWDYIERDWSSDKFSFCLIGDLSERKNPFAAIRAFRELKEEHEDFRNGAELHIKSSGPFFHPAMEQWCPGLFIHTDKLSTEQLRKFYGQMHCYLSTSRGEGKNLPALEFGTTGGAVIVTNMGGHKQWLSSSYAYPVGGEMVPESPSNPDCKWFEADAADLKKQMLHVFRDRGDAARKGDAAAHFLPQTCSWDAVVARFFNRLRDELPGGAWLYHQAQNCRDNRLDPRRAAR